MAPKVNRKCVRYPVNWEVKTLNGQPVADTSLFDLSAVGAKLEGPKPLAPGNHLEFTYVKPDDDRERCHTGVVMWLRPLIHKPGRYQMGVKFYGTDWSLDQELRQGAQLGNICSGGPVPHQAAVPGGKEPSGMPGTGTGPGGDNNQAQQKNCGRDPGRPLEVNPGNPVLSRGCEEKKPGGR
jgi:hypothetical protein